MCFFEWIFFFALFFIFYTYFLYPFSLFFLKWACGKTPNQNNEFAIYPMVTLIISAFNEEKIIQSKIENSLNMDYPADRLQILIASDCSSDATDEIVKSFPSRVTLIRSSSRVGKNECLNIAVAHCLSEILVFSDADCLYDKLSIKELVKFFNNPKIGGVTGKLSVVGKSTEGLYRRYEEFVRELEGGFGRCINATGTIFAIRRVLFKPLKPTNSNDFATALDVLSQNHDFAYSKKAIAYETETSSADEYKRKIRTISRGMNVVIDKLTSLKGPIFLQVVSHKILRWLIWFFLIIAFLTNALLITKSSYFLIYFILQLVAYFFALGYACFPKTFKRFSIFYYFVKVNIAALVAFYKTLTGKHDIIWKSPLSSREKT